MLCHRRLPVADYGHCCHYRFTNVGGCMLPVRAFTILLVITWIGCGANAQSPRIFIESRTGDAISVSSSTNHTWQFGPNSGGGLGFGFYDETAGSTRLQLTLNGYVGIGTTTPGFRLDVNGPIRSSMGGLHP